MTDNAAPQPRVAVRRPHRADARRNFDALLNAAREAFAQHGTEASLEEIARRAGVGIGTLYRNFPTRQDLFDSVYVGEVEELCRAAEEVANLPPWDAFVAWLRRFVGYVATKRAIYEALNRDSEMFRSCRIAMYAAGEPLLVRAQEAGDARSDANFDDILRMITGITATGFVDDAQRERVLGIALDGLRVREHTAQNAAEQSEESIQGH
ncbi:TetR/AcrR family transcriptional regulator [Planotetraspora sp. A-T 1434]|uniref:TetR/AcrR family transcriptional regulator n=1 Tax=Planotetraspora sp. A-T 1434 TaxID=2979219 RepID=UPI0021C0136C|nr:TetR/AcrR family transcriptional regulator [Planotetraspora sp. A-T 1434]MCT9935188.1 TetR/AcrR family transcriptional regulator [Planotetraspora sp. A-T 1434]